MVKSESQEKREFTEDSLSMVGATKIVIQTDVFGVLLPKSLYGRKQILIKISEQFPNADVATSAWGIYATLSFAGTKFRVGVPWTCVLSVENPMRMKVLYGTPAPILSKFKLIKGGKS